MERPVARRRNSGTDGTFSDICFTRLAWLIMTGHFRERETSRLSPSVEIELFNFHYRRLQTSRLPSKFVSQAVLHAPESGKLDNHGAANGVQGRHRCYQPSIWNWNGHGVKRRQDQGSV